MRKDTIFSYYIAVPQLYCDVASKINENHLLVCLHVEIFWCREWKHRRPYRLHEFFCFNFTNLYKFVIFSIVILFCILFVHGILHGSLIFIFPLYWFLCDYSAGIFLWQKSYSVLPIVFFNLYCTSCPFLYKEQKKINNEPLKLHYLWSWTWQFKCWVSFQVAGHMQQFTLSWVLFKKGNLICFSISTFLPVLHCSKLNMPSP